MSHGGKGFYVAVAGFVDSNVILFVAMFIVGGALFETGMANKIGGVVTHFAKSEKQLIIAIMIITFLCTVWLQASAGAQGRRGWDKGFRPCTEVEAESFPHHTGTDTDRNDF